MLGGETLGTLRVNIEANLQNFNTSISTAQASLRTWGQSMTNIVQQHQQALTMLGTSMAGVGAVLVGGVGLAVKTFADFESAMKNVQAISNATQKEFEDLSAYAMKLGKDTVFSSKQAAEALYYMASAGYSVKDQMKATDSVLQLATATQWGLAQSAEFVASTITAFGLKAENAGHVVDVMAKSTAMSLLTMDKLGYAMPYVAANARMLGISVEETAAALSMLADGGLRSEMMGERFRLVLNTLNAPTKAETEALTAMGISADSVKLSLHPLSEVIKVFESHIGMAGEKAWNAANANKIFGERAEGAMILVAQGSEKLDKLTTAYINSADAAKKMADINQEALSKSFEQLTGSIANLLIKMGGELAPTVKTLTGQLEDLVDKIANMNPTLQTGLTFLTTWAGGMTLASGAAIVLLAKLPDLIRGMEALGLTWFGLGASLGVVAAGLSAIMLLINKAEKDLHDPTVQAAKRLNELQTEAIQLTNVFAQLKDKGLDPTNMTLGEFKNSSFEAKIAAKGFAESLQASYGDNVKMKDILIDMTSKTWDYQKALGSERKVTEEFIPFKGMYTKAVIDAGKAVADTGDATGELTDAEKKLLDQMKGDLNPSLEKSREIFQNIRLDTHGLTLVTDELGFSYKALTSTIHETAKRSQEDSVETMKTQVQAFDDTEKAMVVLSGAYVNLLNKEKLLNDELMSIRILALPKLLEAEQKAHDKSVTDAITYWGKKIDVDNKFEKDVTKIAGEAIAERNAGFDDDATKRLIADADQYQKEEEQLLKFESNKAKIYESKKEQLALTYDQMYDLAVGHGKDTNDIEKWYHDESLKLTMQYYNNYAEIVQGATSSVAESYLGLHHLLTNSEMDNEALQKTAIVRLANWVDDQVKLLKDLEDAYVSVTKVIGILGTVIDWLSGKSGGSSGGGIGDLTSLLSKGGETAGGGGILSQLKGLFGGGNPEEIVGGTTAGGTSWLSSFGAGLTGGGTGAAATVGGIAATVATAASFIGGFLLIAKELSDWQDRKMNTEYLQPTNWNVPSNGYQSVVDSLTKAAENQFINSWSNPNIDLTFGGNAPEKTIRGGSNIRIDIPMISGIIQRVGDDSKSASTLVSEGLSKVDTSINNKINETNNILIDLSKRQPSVWRMVTTPTTGGGSFSDILRMGYAGSTEDEAPSTLSGYKIPSGRYKGYVLSYDRSGGIVQHDGGNIEQVSLEKALELYYGLDDKGYKDIKRMGYAGAINPLYDTIYQDVKGAWQQWQQSNPAGLTQSEVSSIFANITAGTYKTLDQAYAAVRNAITDGSQYNASMDTSLKNISSLANIDNVIQRESTSTVQITNNALYDIGKTLTSFNDFRPMITYTGSIDKKMDILISKQDELIRKQPSAWTPTVSQSAIDSVADLVAQSLRRRNVM